MPLQDSYPRFVRTASNKQTINQSRRSEFHKYIDRFNFSLLQNGSPAPAKKPHRKKSKMPVLSRYGKRKRRRSSTPHAAGAAYGKGGKSSGKGGKVVPSTVVRPPMNNGLVLSRAPYGGGAYDVGASLLLPSSPPHTPALTTTSCSGVCLVCTVSVIYK